MRLLVIETGAGRLDARFPPHGSDQTAVVVQRGAERPAELAVRSIRRVQVLESSEQCIELTVLALAARFDSETMAARLALARALATHSATTNARSELVLSPPAGAWLGDWRAGLLALVDALTGEPESWSLPVLIQFAQAGAPLRRSSPAGVPGLRSARAAPGFEFGRRSNGGEG